MILAPDGIPGERLIEPFLRMAQGRNARHELYLRPGHFQHPDGWGAVIEDGGRLLRVRSTSPCWEGKALETLAGRRVFLLHARRASVGGLGIQNVHPFERDARDRRWFFCHNGTIRGPLPRPSGAEGDTDSEAYFGVLLDALGRPAAAEALALAVSSLEDYTALNAFLLSKAAAFVICAWRDLETYYTLHACDTPDGPVFSSEPLAEFGTSWQALACGEIRRVDRSSGRVSVTHAAKRGV